MLHGYLAMKQHFVTSYLQFIQISISYIIAGPTDFQMPGLFCTLSCTCLKV